MNFGVYIVGNDYVLNHVQALVNSIRYYNRYTDITLIPYSNEYEKVLTTCDIDLFPDLDLIEQLDSGLVDLFSLPTAPAQANKYSRLKNLAAWFGPYQQFVSLDADITVFTDLENFCKELLGDNDFINYDRTYSHGVKWVFTEQIRKIFSKDRLQNVFNNGFWISRKGLFNFEEVLEHLRKCKERYEYFDFANGVIAQPIINSLVLDSIPLDKINYLAHNKLPEPWVGF